MSIAQRSKIVREVPPEYFMRYRHCLLRKGVTQQMAWIPEPFAKVGKYLRIGESDGWLVDAVYSAKPEEYILKHRDECRNAFRKYCWEVAQVAERLTLNQQVATSTVALPAIAGA